MTPAQIAKELQFLLMELERLDFTREAAMQIVIAYAGGVGARRVYKWAD